MKLSFEDIGFTDDGYFIPSKKDPSSRVWVSADRTHIELQHEYCDVYLRGDEEIEEWSWHAAARQPDAIEQEIIMKELHQYAANKIISSRTMR